MPQFAHCRPLTLPHLSSNFRKYFLKGVRTSSRTHGTRVNALYNPFPFNADDYHRANLQLLQGDDQQMTGLMLFQKENKDGDIIDDGEGLVIAIGGDTFQAIVLLLQGRLEIRPLTVDLLCRVLEQAQTVSEKDWTIVRVAITDIVESTFIGRIFFGDSASEEISWDVDCRPSDGIFLALKHGVPIYIHEKVWAAVSAPLDELKEKKNAQSQMTFDELHAYINRQRNRYQAFLSGGHSNQQSGREKLDAATLMTTVCRSDPDAVRLLKMKLRLAISEEDYAAAAKIRDHVFMKLSVAQATAKQDGDDEAAANYEKTLKGYIESMESGGMPDHSDGTGDEPPL